MPHSLAHIPGDLGLPVLGDTFGFLTRPLELYNEKQRRYGNVFKMRLFGRTAVYLLGADANRFMLVEQAGVMSNKEGWEFPIGELFHGGLMLRDGEEHKTHRALLQTGFKKEPLASYLPLMTPIIRQRLAEWRQQPDLRVFPAVKALTLELAGKVFFDLDFSKDLERINRAIADIVRASTTAVPFNLPFTLYRRGMESRRILQAYFGNVVKQRRAEPAKTALRQDMLSRLCVAGPRSGEGGYRMTDAELVDHLIFFVMAAHDTTASSLTSLCYRLAENPDWQARVREEAVALGDDPTLDGPTLNRLEQLGLVIQETLRLHPPLIILPRVATTNLQYEGYHIPKGTHVNALLEHNHKNPQQWADPERFDPLRFAAGRQEHRRCPYGYAPFGAGQHYCLGFQFADLQLRLVMYHLLTTYQWQLPERYVVKYTSIPIQHPADGLRIVLQDVVTTPVLS